MLPEEEIVEKFDKANKVKVQNDFDRLKKKFEDMKKHVEEYGDEEENHDVET